MPNIETNVLAVVNTDAPHSLVAGSVRTAGRSFARIGSWAGDTAQKFAALLADLMAPAVFLVYALTAWSLASNFGWTNSFLFTSGPMSNWIIWLGFAVLLNLASSILKRRTQSS